jgi:hypothetical protein
MQQEKVQIRQARVAQHRQVVKLKSSEEGVDVRHRGDGQEQSDLAMRVQHRAPATTRSGANLLRGRTTVNGGKEAVMNFTIARRYLNVIAAVTILAAIPRAGFASRPCTCEDLNDFRSVIDQTARSITAWDNILGKMETMGWPQNTDQAIQEFKTEVWGANAGSVVQTGGLDSSGEPTLNPKVRDRYCQTIVDAIDLHEQAHHNYYLWSHLWESLTASSDLERAMVLAGSEADAYSQELHFLWDEFEKLKKACEKPKPSLSPDAEQQKSNQAQQKHEVARAATRVAAYANSLK